MNIQELKDFIARDLYGLTAAEAQADGICIRCKEPALAKCKTELGKREYQITGICETCWPEVTK